MVVSKNKEKKMNERDDDFIQACDDVEKRLDKFIKALEKIEGSLEAIK